MNLIRLAALIKKELQAVLGDKQSLRILIAPVIMQLLIFPFAATMEVRNNTLGVFNEDRGNLATEVVQRLSRTEAFTAIVPIHGEEQVRDLIDRQEALVVLRFSSGFSEGVRMGRPPPVQAILDGRRSNPGQIALGYVQAVLGSIPLGDSLVERSDALVVRNWYNPNLDYRHFILTSLVAMITTLSALIVTALSVAREREQGTLDQLLVSPLTPAMIFVGKAVPAFVVALLQATIILLGSVYGYGVAFQGSVSLLYACTVPYVFALVGIGLLISTMCTTQQQAFLGVFLFVMPAILLSGFVSPVDNMPEALQTLTLANPVRHFIGIAKGIYLKAVVLEDLWASLGALLAIGVVTSTSSLLVFRRRLS